MTAGFFVLLIAISAIGPLALNGVLPATGAVMQEYSASFAEVQLLLTLFLAANLVSQLILGPAADRFGRRPIMLVSLALFVAGSVGCALAPSMSLLLVARVVQGFGGAVCVFLPRTIVRDLFTQDKAASMMGYMTTAMMAAPLFGPALGGWLTDNAGWQVMYWGFALLGLFLFIWSFYAQPETMPQQPMNVVDSYRQGELSVAPSRPGSGLAKLLREPLYVALVIALTGSVGVYYAFLSGAPYVAMESRAIPASSYGAWFSVVALGYMSGNLLAGRLSERLGAKRMIRIGILPFSLGIIGFWVFSGNDAAFALFLPMMLVALSNGMSLPNLIASAIGVRPELAATASGFAGSVQTGVGVLVSLLLAVMLPVGDQWLFIVVTMSFALTMLGLWQLHRLDSPVIQR